MSVRAEDEVGEARRARSFEAAFWAASAVQASAPGRVNLLGEHTDYNDGFVLPTATPQRTTVSRGPSPDGQPHLLAMDLDERVVVAASGDASADGPLVAAPGFARYVLGCLRLFAREGHRAPPLRVHVTSTVPMGAGLSRSAALEVATLRALRAFTGVALDDVRIAKLGQRAEIEFVGLNCGIMDQMASSLADTTPLLFLDFLDTQSRERRLLPLPEGAEILVLDSGIARLLTGSGDNERRAQCEEAARLLGVKALRDVNDPAALSTLPVLLRRHVSTENRRVLEAEEGLGASAFGALMNASHASLRDDYEVSVPLLDVLVGLLQATPGVFGARLTGAGFGGACVALVAAGREASIAEDACERYGRVGGAARVLVPDTPG